MEVKTSDYYGKERRNSGSKLRLSMRDYIKLLTLAFSFLVAGITFYINTNNITSALAKDCEASTEINRKQDESIIVLKEDIKYIREGMKDMKSDQSIMNKKFSENTKLLYRILGKLESEESSKLYQGYAGDPPIIRR